jgi:hypothetical protein
VWVQIKFCQAVKQCRGSAIDYTVVSVAALAEEYEVGYGPARDARCSGVLEMAHR